MEMRSLVSKVCIPVVLAVAALAPGRAAAQVIPADRFCDPAYEDCRQPLLDLIAAETVGIDVGFWFMQDARYAHALIQKKRDTGIPIRVIFDSQAFNDFEYPGAEIPVAMMANPSEAGYPGVAGIPLRDKTGGSGIFHYKMMLFAGQGVVQFSGANYSDEAFVYRTPYANYVDEVIMFSNTPSIVNSFKTKFDDAWTDTTSFSNYANVTTLSRSYDTYPIDPELQFVPTSNFASRSVTAYRAETQAIDAIMYRVTDQRHSNEMIAAVQRGVPVRFIGEPLQYRSNKYYWVSWNLDRMYMAGVQMRMRGHAGLSHEKLTLLRGQSKYIFGSSNWTSASATAQHEHNIFGTNAGLLLWAQQHFDRKWNNTGPVVESIPFVPLPPDILQNKAPADSSQNVSFAAGVTLRWYPGQFAHRYDIYLGTSSNPATMSKIVDDVDMGPSATAATGHQKSFTIPASLLQAGTTYYWRVVSRTMANLERQGPTWSFRTEGGAPPTGAGNVVLWAQRAENPAGWTRTADATAAGGFRLANANAGAPNPGVQASPTRYFDLNFNAAPGEYRVWIRGKATSNSWQNDSVFVQFSSSVTPDGTSETWRIGTTSATSVTIEDCSSCGLSGWGWNDNATGLGVLGPTVHLTGAGPHTIRVQVREDGLSIDQIILAGTGSAHFSTAPGETKNDGNIYPEQGGTSGSGEPPPPPPPPACSAATLPSNWARADIGGVGATGSSCFDASTMAFTVNGSGADIWGTADEFQFAYRELTGDGKIQARVATLTNTDAWTKSGVMMRETLTPGSKHAMMIVSNTKGLAFQRRVSTGGVSTSTSGGAGTVAQWVKIERTGDLLTASRSADGENWTVVGTETIVMGPTIFVGLPITSHRDGTIATATLTDVTVP
jgi:hypothetical protein